jgi:hypothetical protein
MTRRSTGNEGEILFSTFVSVIEPYEGVSKIANIRRLPLFDEDGTPYGDSYVALEISLTDGGRDLFIAADSDNATGQILVQPEWNVRCDAEVCHVRINANGEMERLLFCRGRSVQVGERRTELETKEEYYEWNISGLA